MSNQENDETRTRIVNITKVVGGLLLAVGALLPSSLSERFNAARKAVVATAGSLLAVAASLDALQLTGTASAWVGYGTAALTAVATYWVPNRS